MSAPPALPDDNAAPVLETDAAAPLLFAQAASPLIRAGEFEFDQPDGFARAQLEELVAEVHRVVPNDYAALIEVASQTYGVLLDHRGRGRVFDAFGECGGFLIVVQLLAALGSSVQDDADARTERAELLHLALAIVTVAITYSAANLYNFGATVTWDGLKASLQLVAEANGGQLAVGVVGGLFGLAVGNVAAGAAQFTSAWEGEGVQASRHILVHPGAISAAFDLATAPKLEKAAYVVLDALLKGHPRNALLLSRTQVASPLLFSAASKDDLFDIRQRILTNLFADGIQHNDVRQLFRTDSLDEHVVELLRTVAKSAHHPRAVALGASSICLDALPHPFPSQSSLSTGYSIVFSVKLDEDSTIVQIGDHINFLRITTVDGTLCIEQGLQNTRTKLSRALLSFGTWHSVVITHARAAAGSRSSLHVFLDGHRASSVPVTYPTKMDEPTRLTCGSRGAFSLGPLLFMDGVLPSSLPLLLHELSPAYSGNFQSPLLRFLTPSGRARVEERVVQVNERGARRGSHSLDALHTVLQGAAPQVFSLGRFYAHLDAAHTGQIHGQLVILNKAYAYAQDALDTPSGHARLCGVPTLSVPFGIDDGVWRAGGVTKLVQIIRRSETPSALSSSVALMLELVSRSWRLAEDAERNKCYELLAVVLRDKADMIELRAFQSVMDATGTEPLANTDLFRAVLLDTQIWPRTQSAVQQAYLDHFVDMGTARNSHKLSRMPVIKRLVMFARTADAKLCAKLRRATAAAVTFAFSVSGIQALILHIVSTLAGVFDIDLVLDQPSVKTVEETITLTQPKELSVSPVTLSLLWGLVDAAEDPTVIARLARTISAKWIILLLRPGAPASYVVPSLELVGMLLGENVFSRKFQYAGGFRVLERTLPIHWNQPSVLPWLWTLFFADQRPTRATLYTTFAPRKSWPRPDAPLVRHGAVIRSILACIGKGIECICTKRVQRRRSLPELKEAGDLAAADTAKALIEDSVALLSRHGSHPEVQSLLLHPHSVLLLLAAIQPSVCEQRHCSLANELLNIFAGRLSTALLQSVSLAPLTVVHTSMPVPNPLIQSKLCTRVYHRLLVEIIHAMRTGPVHRATLSMLCSLLELVSNESLRDAPLQRAVFSLGGFIISKAEVSRLAPSTREQLVVSLQRNVLHALACNMRGQDGADAFAFCVSFPQLLGAADGVFVECVLYRALNNSSMHAATVSRLIRERYPDMSMEMGAYKKDWKTVYEGQQRFLVSLIHESMRVIYTSIGQDSARTRALRSSHARMSAWYRSIVDALAHQAELDALGDASADAPEVLDADASLGGVTLTFDPDSSIVADVPPTSAQDDAQEVPNDEYEDKLHTVMRSLEKGDTIERVFNMSRVVGVDAQGSLLVVGRENMYMLDNYFQRPNGELVSIADAPPEERDALVVATRPGGADALHLVRVVEGDAPVRHWRWSAIKSVFRRAWLHRRTAIELFFADGQSTLLVLPNSSLAEQLYRVFRSKAHDAVAAAEELALGIQEQYGIPQTLANTRLTGAVFRRASVTGGGLTGAWAAGEISNAQYLTTLNTLAGRTFNDLTQFPVFPWVLADYVSESLDLENPKTYRNLALPMGAQTENRRKEFAERYHQLEEVGIDPFHYGTHYSTASSVCSFLVRMLPYSDILVDLQGGTFDLADRTFSSVGRSWYSASELSRGDVRELIPEFFTLPEMFENPNKFEFGTTQGGARVDKVELPPWAYGDPVLFVQRHREALESGYVSAHLHEWIDLIFGYKAHGKEAVKAMNVFHPLSYADSIDLDAIESPHEREAAAQVIHNFGQTPRALFSRPHPSRNVPLKSLFWDSLAHLSEHVRYLTRSAAPVFTADVPIARMYGDPPDHAVSSETVVFRKLGMAVSTGFVDRSVRLSRLGEHGHRFVAILEQATLAAVTCSCAVDDSRVLIGSADGVVQLFSITSSPSIVLDCVLTRHTDAVLSAAISTTWGIIVTGSADNTAVVWDLNRRRAVHILRGFDDNVHLVAVDEGAGWIATACNTDVWVWSVNGRLIARQSMHAISREPVSSLSFSAKEFHIGHLAVLVTGHRGQIAIWNVVSRHTETEIDEPRWGLNLVRTLDMPSLTTALSVHDSRIFAGDQDGDVYCLALPGHAVNVPSESCMGGCNKKFGFLDARRNCAACGCTMCTACSTVFTPAGSMRLCKSCHAILSRDDVALMNTM
ncbi:beige protein-like 1 [Malassezia cuniculi]|uniref:Beige protein homolog 1 n=1 Tax=Malassezia cuniculi TaxID=948313 RepID=A0AAF0EY40_9BASI|nr:beige protein-like 1 [Malassezia cuniculi]